MENNRPTSEELDVYQKVNDYLNSKLSQKKDDSFSLFPKPALVWIIIITALVTLVSSLCYYGLTTILFGEEFWIKSITS